MTAHETVPATSPRQADDAFLAACNALLVALANPNVAMTSGEVDLLLDAMPDSDLRDGLHFGLSEAGVLPAGHYSAIGGLGR